MTSKPYIADQEKLAHRIARQIETEIVNSGSSAGDNLGTEQDIAARFGIGRSTMRQALTLVSRSGLAKVRSGADGGLIVTTPDEAAVADALRNFLKVAPIDITELLEARRQFEDVSIRLAIERQDAAASSRLRELASEAGATPTLVHELLEAISAASNNPYLSLVCRTLASLSWPFFGPVDAPEQRAVYDKIEGSQLSLAEAIVAVDVGRALSLNAAIFGHFRDLVDLQRKAPISPDGAPEPFFRRAAPEKRGEAIARDIKRRIAVGALAPGDRIASESELIATYGASRGVVRDCVRILEQWSIATTIRGKSGGLYATRPTADSVLRTAGRVSALFLAIVTLIGMGLGAPATGFITEYVFADKAKLGLSLTLVTVIVAPLVVLNLYLVGRKIRRMRAAA